MEDNQCDGCKRGLAVKDKIHFEKDGKPYIGCSSSLYEKSHRPSDLEIVQKALGKCRGDMSLADDGWVVYVPYVVDGVIAEGVTAESLLTWAKQQIGVE